jgi:group I intron endonuclease
MIRTCYVYLYVNVLNGQAYVGKTTDLKRRHNVHRYAAKRDNSHFYNAIRQHGWDAFKHRVVATHASDEEAYEGERKLIAELRRLGFRLYNEQEGGEGAYDASLERREKMSLKAKRPCTPDRRAQLSALMSGSGNPMFGRKHSTASIKKNTASNRVATAGEKNGMFGRKHTPESRELMSAGHRGFVPSETTRALWSERQRGEGNSFFGKQHSDASKAKIKQAATLREERKRLLRANSELAPFDVWV